MQILIKSGNHL